MGDKLHLVFGGELTDPSSVNFRDSEDIDIVGIFPNYDQAYGAWKAASQRNVDNAHMRYFIAHLHRLIGETRDEPEKTPLGGRE
ncbi:MAG: DUF4170 domain-containing protein [Pseudomonadota bacterium]